jgi:hypothetical protein
MRFRSMIVLALLGVLGGCAQNRSDREPEELVAVLVTPQASRDGLPQPPRVVGSKRDEQQARRAEAAYAERIDAVARSLIPELRRAGARDISAHRLHGLTHIRAVVPSDAIASLEERSDVARVIELVKHTGRVERRDLALILTTDAGRKYELRGLLGPAGRDLDGARIEVEGEEWRGAVAPPPVQGLVTFIVYDWRRLR